MKTLSKHPVPLPIEALSAGRGFLGDTRFAPPGETATTEEPKPEPADDAPDPIAQAWAKGHAAGLAEARAEAEKTWIEQAAIRERLALSLSRLDDALADSLRQRLHDTVAALCEAALAPLALNHAALMARVERAVAMVRRVDDERVIRLHPDDIALVAPGLDGGWRTKPDPALERGALRVDYADGGVEDGPEQWRCAIAEALGQC